MSYTSPGLAAFQNADLDVDFPVAATEAFAMCGMIEDEREFDCASYEDAEAIIPRSEWSERIRAIDAVNGWLERLIVKVKNQGREGSCFPAGTLIRMADGTQKPIEDVKTLDEVLTAEGRTHRVMATSVRHSYQLMRIRLRGHGILQVTPEHPILTRRGYVAVNDLAAGDEVRIPRYTASNGEKWIETKQFIELRAHTTFARGTRHVGIPGKATATIVRTPVPDVIHLTPGFGRIVGLFLAEGSTSHQKVTWTLGSHEAETLVPELVQLLKVECDATAKVTRRNNAIKVEVFGVQWSRMFSSLCCTGARFKRIHPIFSGASLEFQKEMLWGWIAGDGHRLKIGTTAHTGVTVSKELAFGMFDIANALGYRPAIRRDVPKLSHGVKHRFDRWTVRINEQDSQHPGGYKAPVDDGAMWRPVEAIEEVPFCGWVYNLEVEDDHSYVADGIGVHNCVYNAAAQATEIAWNKTFGVENWVELSPISGYRNNARGPSSGSSVPGALTWMADHGLIPVDSEANKAKVAAGFFKHVHPATGYWVKPEAGWPETAKLFRVQEWLKLTSVEAWVSALLQGFPCVGGRSGHCIAHVRPMLDGKSVYSMYANSWSEGWGSKQTIATGLHGGFGIDSEGKIDTMTSRGAWCVRTVYVPPWLEG